MLTMSFKFFTLRSGKWAEIGHPGGRNSEAPSDNEPSRPGASGPRANLTNQTLEKQNAGKINSLMVLGLQSATFDPVSVSPAAPSMANNMPDARDSTPIGTSATNETNRSARRERCAASTKFELPEFGTRPYGPPPKAQTNLAHPLVSLP